MNFFAFSLNATKQKQQQKKKKKQSKAGKKNYLKEFDEIEKWIVNLKNFLHFIGYHQRQTADTDTSKNAVDCCRCCRCCCLLLLLSVGGGDGGGGSGWNLRPAMAVWKWNNQQIWTK